MTGKLGKCEIKRIRMLSHATIVTENVGKMYHRVFFCITAEKYKKITISYTRSIRVTQFILGA